MFKVHKKIKENKKIIGLLVLLLLVVLLGGRYYLSQRNTAVAQEEPTKVRLQKIQAGSSSQSSVYTGEVRSYREIPMSFQTAGRVISRRVEIGSYVKAGDVIGILDAKDLNQEARGTKAQIASAAAQLDLAKKNLDRYHHLWEQEAISREVLDQYEQQYKTAAATLEEMQAKDVQAANQMGIVCFVPANPV